MKKHLILKTSVIALTLIILMQITAFAYNVTLKLSADKNAYDVNKEITLTVNWGEELEAVGFTINYDASKVKFVSTDIGEYFYNATDAGKVDVNWASMEGNALTQMIFKFITLAEGEVEFSITGADKDKFSNGDLVAPEILEASNAKVKIIIAKPEEPAPTNPIQPDDGKTEQNPTTGTTNKVDNTVAGGKMPQTGAETTVLFVAGIVALIGIIGLKKYRKLSDI